MSDEKLKHFLGELLGTPLQIDAYYDAARKEFLVKNSGGRWLLHGRSAFTMLLRQKGISTKQGEKSLISPAEEVIAAIINERDVRYAAPLAGRNSGFYDEGGVRFLVTESPKIIQPTAGDCSTIKTLIDGLLGGDPEYGEIQRNTFLGWMRIAYCALVAGHRQPGQRLVLAGPVACGKSLVQLLITEVLGGRCAKSYRYLTGGTDFNSELFAAEHLVLEDEHSSTDMRSRHQMAAGIKGITVNEVHSCHGKNRDAINLRPFWRLSISLNDQTENLQVLPPITEDIADKLIVLKCWLPKNPFPTQTSDLRRRYWEKIVEELPAFVHFLKGWEVPPELADQRFGVRHFHHPEIREELGELEPETKLLEQIDRELWRNIAGSDWSGTAGDLETILRAESSLVKCETQRLLKWANACGTYLGRLADRFPHRVQKKRTAQERAWRIAAPVSTVTPSSVTE